MRTATSRRTGENHSESAVSRGRVTSSWPVMPTPAAGSGRARRPLEGGNRPKMNHEAVRLSPFRARESPRRLHGRADQQLRVLIEADISMFRPKGIELW